MMGLVEIRKREIKKGKKGDLNVTRTRNLNTTHNMRFQINLPSCFLEERKKIKIERKQ